MNDMTASDWDKLEKNLPHYVREEGTYMVVPAKRPDGKFEWVNLSYFFPWGNQMEIFRDVKGANWADLKKDVGISNPFLTAFEMIPAKEGPLVHPYFGTPIYNRVDPPHIKAAKTVEALAFTWAPSMLSRQGALGYTTKAITGEKDRWGREVTPGQAIGRWFGVNILTTSKTQTIAIKKAQINDVKNDLTRALRDPSLSKEKKQQMREEARKQIKDIRKN
jgi:hypothetical protein